MRPFAYNRAPDVQAAIAHGAAGAEFVAGGTDMLQLLQENLRAPATLVDINGLSLTGIGIDGDALQIGALTRLSDAAAHADVQTRFAVVSQALDATASAQVRNMATVGGNLLQRTRCLYFRDPTMPCNRRQPGSGCPAQDGCNEINAILGGSPDCIAAHPSDLAVALVALDAGLVVTGPAGERRIAVADLHRLPGDTPHIETVLEPGELITAVRLPMAMADRQSAYVKVRHRASFEWAIASCAVTLSLSGQSVQDSRIVAGGVATKPWRLPQVEARLAGRRLDVPTIHAAAEAAAEGAMPRAGNAWKVPLLQRTVARAIITAAGLP